MWVQCEFNVALSRTCIVFLNVFLIVWLKHAIVRLNCNVYNKYSIGRWADDKTVERHADRLFECHRSLRLASLPTRTQHIPLRCIWSCLHSSCSTSYRHALLVYRIARRGEAVGTSVVVEVTGDGRASTGYSPERHSRTTSDVRRVYAGQSDHGMWRDHGMKWSDHGLERHLF